MRRFAYWALGISLMSLAILLGIMLSTTPADVSSQMLLVVFVAAYGLLYGFFAFVCTSLHMLRITRGTAKLYRRICLALAGLVTFILVLQSIGQLTVRDIAIGLLFAGLLYAYYGRLRGRKTNESIAR